MPKESRSSLSREEQQKCGFLVEYHIKDMYALPPMANMPIEESEIPPVIFSMLNFTNPASPVFNLGNCVDTAISLTKDWHAREMGIAKNKVNLTPELFFSCIKDVGRGIFLGLEQLKESGKTTHAALLTEFVVSADLNSPWGSDSYAAIGALGSGSEFRLSLGIHPRLIMSHPRKDCFLPYVIGGKEMLLDGKLAASIAGTEEMIHVHQVGRDGLDASMNRPKRRYEDDEKEKEAKAITGGIYAKIIDSPSLSTL